METTVHPTFGFTDLRYHSADPTVVIAPSQQGFLAQYGPIIAALVALLGALVVHISSSRRARNEFSLTREDEYRKEMRELLGVLIANAKDFHRQSLAMINVPAWGLSGHEQATALRDATESSISTLQQNLAVARLTAQDAVLQGDLTTLSAHVDAVAGRVHHAVNAFWEDDPIPDSDSPEVRADFQAFEDSTARLHSHALEILRPTIREKNGASGHGSDWLRRRFKEPAARV